MMKIIIIFNKNEKNLELLVDSFKKYLQGEYEIFILDQNNLLTKEFEDCKIFSSNKLKEDIISIIESDQKNNFIIVDENKYCYEEIKLDEIEECLQDENIFCFSLSLGRNIKYCSNMNCDNVFMPIEQKKNIMYWDWSVHYMDFGYPLNLDGTIFRGKELLKFLKNINFSNSIELENNLQIFDNYPKNIMCCFSKSKIIEIIFENKNEISIFNIDEIVIDRTKHLIKNKKYNEITN